MPLLTSAAWRTWAEAARLRTLPRPRQVHLTPTSRCFLPCQQCELWRTRGEGERDEAFWAGVIDALARWPGPGTGVNFAGGEPLVRRDLPSLAARAAGRGLRVSTNTNGWLVDPPTAARMAGAGFAFVTVSIDGARAATHDALRGRAGSHRRACEAVHNLLGAGIPDVTVATILWRDNLAELEALIDWCESIGAHLTLQALYESFGASTHDPRWSEASPLFPRDHAAIDRAIDVALTARARGARLTNPPAQLEAMRRYLHAPARPLGLRCRAGRHDFVIDSRGQLRLCYYTEPVADAATVTPAAAWASARAAGRRAFAGRCPRSCSLLNCNFEA